MKKIALLGGTSWPSTIEYYSALNQKIQDKLGGYHSCPLLLYNIDYHEIKSRYTDGRSEIPQLLKTEIEKILALQPHGLIICNNTLHKAFGLIRSELNITIPVFHVIELTTSHILENNWNRVLLLGTKFTMEDSYFRQPLLDAGIHVDIPDASERNEIQSIQSQLAQGIFQETFNDFFQNLTDKYAEYDAFILGCTELPLVFKNIQSRPALINTIELQCIKAIEFITN